MSTGTVSPEEKPAVKTHSDLGKDTHDRDVLGMGRTAGQRTAELLAGLRAELLHTSETNALARISGRIAARLITTLGSKKILNFIPVRLGSYTGLIKRSLGNQVAGKVLVELGSGFSPRGIQIARDLPELRVIEIDLPDVVTEKKRRLEKGRIPLPSNWTVKAADMGVEALSDILNREQVDVVTAEGVLAYFQHADITRIARQIRQSLKPGGIFLTDIGYMSPQAMQDASAIVKIFRRYTTSNTPGFVYDEETARRLFKDAEYTDVELYRVSQTATMFNLPQPVSDAAFFVVSKR
jgi:O-methyltransferase involved in polyketide biosynthesis